MGSPPISVASLLDFEDVKRRILRVSLAPSGLLVAAADNVGRVSLYDLRMNVVVRQWKGVRDAKVAWDDRGSAGPGLGSTLVLAIYAPQVGLLSLYALLHGACLRSIPVGMQCHILTLMLDVDMEVEEEREKDQDVDLSLSENGEAGTGTRAPHSSVLTLAPPSVLTRCRRAFCCLVRASTSTTAGASGLVFTILHPFASAEGDLDLSVPNSVGAMGGGASSPTEGRGAGACYREGDVGGEGAAISAMDSDRAFSACKNVLQRLGAVRGLSLEEGAADCEAEGLGLEEEFARTVLRVHSRDAALRILEYLQSSELSREGRPGFPVR